MPEWSEMTKQLDWRAKQISLVAWVSEDMKYWEAWDITCGPKAKNITPLIAWSTEAGKW